MTDFNRHITNLSNAEYHAAEGISKSKLDAISISPLNYWDKYINPDSEPQEDKHCFLIGGGTHKLVLEPETFEQEYAIGFNKSLFTDALDTADDMREELLGLGQKVSGTKSELAKRLLECGVSPDRIMMNLERDYYSSISGKEIIPAEDYRHMLKSLQSINKHHTAGKLINGSMVENSFFATDELGLKRKCRPDFITKNGQICGDLKSTTDVSANGFGRSVSKFRYQIQGAWYLDVLKMVMGEYAPKIFAFVCAQKTRPYDVSVQFLTEEQLCIGRMLYRRDLQRLIECSERNYWPGVDGGDVLEVLLPSWDRPMWDYKENDGFP